MPNQPKYYGVKIETIERIKRLINEECEIVMFFFFFG
jgi:hypothetical protein